MGYILRILKTEEQPALFIRTTTPVGGLPAAAGKAYARIAGYIREQGQEPLGPSFIAFYNMDMENLKVEIGFPTQKPMAGQGDIVSGSIPAGRKAAGFHMGPYGKVGPLYERLARFIGEQGYEAEGTVYELYYNSPQETGEEGLLTEVSFLLKEAAP